MKPQVYCMDLAWFQGILVALLVKLCQHPQDVAVAEAGFTCLKSMGYSLTAQDPAS